MNVITLTQELIRIPSLNPMGRDVDGPPYFENRLTDFLQSHLKELGIPVERQPVMPLRDNLFARIEGRGSLREMLLLLEVHQDTVPVDGMSISPFDAIVADGKIHGRGACDVKGGMAAVLAALSEIAQSDAIDQPTIVVAMTINEENGFDGIRHVCQLAQSGDSRLLPRLPDFAIVTEPTELNVVVAHKGTVRWRCHTKGVAGHSSEPSAGVNAIYRMGEIVCGLRDYAKQGLPANIEHPLVGCPTLSVGMVYGGISVNTIPDHCTIEIDRRTVPDECADAAYEHALRYLEQQLGTGGVQQETPFLSAPGLSSRHNQALAAALSDVCRRNGAAGDQRGVSYGTDAGPLAAEGVPTVVFGPGSINQAHTKNEWIETDSLESAVQILVDFCQNGARALALP